MQSGLNMLGSIYDVTSGSPVFVTTVPLVEIQDGFYSGNFFGLSGKTYLVIVLNYIEPDYVTIDVARAPWAEIYKEDSAPVGFMGFNYGAFDLESDLNVYANIFNCTTGTPEFDSQVLMDHVLGGVYFGSANGESNNCYDVLKFVYQDAGITVDDNWSPGSDTIQLLSGGPGQTIFIGAKLIGQQLVGTLVGQALSATLKESE